MPDYPSYFCHGKQYFAPNSYYRVDGPTSSVLVIPADQMTELPVNYPLAYFLQDKEGRHVSPVTKAEIDRALGKWRRSFNEYM